MRKYHRKEAHVKDDVREVLTKLEAKWYMPVPMGFGAAGVSDFLVCWNGLYFAIETKYHNNKCTANQIQFGEDIVEAGGIFLVINEKNVGELESLMVTCREANLRKLVREWREPDVGIPNNR